VQFTVTGGSSALMPNGRSVSIFLAGENTPHYDTVPMSSHVITFSANAVRRVSYLLATGKYSITLANGDGTYAIEAGITLNRIA
jgi:hypothetical protein